MISHAVSLDGSEGSSRKQKAGTSGVRRQVQCLVSLTQIQKPSTMEQGPQGWQEEPRPALCERALASLKGLPD